MDPPDVWSIFADNLFEKEFMEIRFLSLVGYGPSKVKPFECVGTFSEACAAVELTVLRYLIYRNNVREIRTVDSNQNTAFATSSGNIGESAASNVDDRNTGSMLQCGYDIPLVLINVYEVVCCRLHNFDMSTSLTALYTDFLNGEELLIEQIYKKWSLI